MHDAHRRFDLGVSQVSSRLLEPPNRAQGTRVGDATLAIVSVRMLMQAADDRGEVCL